MPGSAVWRTLHRMVTTGPRRRLLRIAERLGLLLGSTALTLLVVELGFRLVVSPSTYHLMYEPSPDPLLGVEPRRGADFEFRGHGIPIPPTRVRISQQGLRAEAEVAVPKAPGTRRLACLGDSMTFGWGVELRDAWCTRLAAALGPGWEALNLGVPGYNAEQAVRRLAVRGIPLQPDLAVLMLNSSDFQPPLDHGDPGGVEAWLVDHSAAYRWFSLRARVGQRDHRDHEDSGDAGARGPGERTPGHAADGDAAHDDDDPYLERPGTDQILGALDQLVALSRAHRFGVAVFFLSALGRDVLPLLDRLRRRGVLAAGLDEALRSDGTPLTIPQDGHPNAEGHRRIAESMRAALARQGLAPGASP